MNNNDSWSCMENSFATCSTRYTHAAAAPTSVALAANIDSEADPMQMEDSVGPCFERQK